MNNVRFRLLIADDLPAIHDDFRKILQPPPSTLAQAPGLALFAPHLVPPVTGPGYELTFVSQGEAAVEQVYEARNAGRPFAVIFLDVRMPPGIDGIATAVHLRRVDPELLIVLCTAYSDHSPAEIHRRLDHHSDILILKKPFEPVEIAQLAHTLCRQWSLTKQNNVLMRDLSSQVLARTYELEQAQEELKGALHHARAAERAKSAFLSCVSHELNTPLNGIQGAACLVELNEDEETAQLGRIILSAGNRLQRLFARILLYLETEEPSHHADVKPVDLGLLIRDTAAAHSIAAAERGLEFVQRVDLPARLLFGGPPEYCRHALDVLLENAVKFTSAGHVALRVHYTANELVLIVEDTGPGIFGEQQAQIYALFAPGDTSSTRRHSGLGIGLCLARRLVEHLHGSLVHENRHEGGSRFTLRLPARPVVAA